MSIHTRRLHDHVMARSLSLIGAGACVAVFAACSAPGSGSGPPPGPPAKDASSSGPLALPLTVSDGYEPTGFMGDTPADFQNVMMSSDSSQCPSPRVAGALGACYSVQWTPVVSMGQSSAWVGVYWQYPPNNWGMLPGRQIQSGATKVTFAAAGAAGGETIQFIAGGMNTTPGSPDAGLSHSDSFKATKQVTLTKGWANYEIALTGDHYDSVIGAFAWTITTTSAAPAAFYVDNIQWEP